MMETTSEAQRGREHTGTRRCSYCFLLARYEASRRSCLHDIALSNEDEMK